MVVTPTPGQQEYIYDNVTERSANGSLGFYEPGHFHSYYWPWIVTMLIALVGLVGNSTVLQLLGFRIQRNPFSVYILNLAASDAFFLCCAFLISLGVLFPFSPMDRIVLSLVIDFLTCVFYTLGLSLLAAISTERCLSVLFPIWYYCHRPKHTSAVVCAVLWLLAVLLCLLYAFFLYTPFFGLASCYQVPLILAVWLIILTSVLCASSLTLLLRVQCSSQRRQPPRLYLLVLFTVLLFLLCGLAPGISVLSRSFDIPSLPLWISFLLACVNSSANPLIYFFLGSQRHKRREPLRVLLQRALADD